MGEWEHSGLILGIVTNNPQFWLRYFIVSKPGIAVFARISCGYCGFRYPILSASISFICCPKGLPQAYYHCTFQKFLGFWKALFQFIGVEYFQKKPNVTYTILHFCAFPVLFSARGGVLAFRPFFPTYRIADTAKKMRWRISGLKLLKENAIHTKHTQFKSRVHKLYPISDWPQSIAYFRPK